jgi:hypothetical protein
VSRFIERGGDGCRACGAVISRAVLEKFAASGLGPMLEAGAAKRRVEQEHRHPLGHGHAVGQVGPEVRAVPDRRGPHVVGEMCADEAGEIVCGTKPPVNAPPGASATTPRSVPRPAMLSTFPLRSAGCEEALTATLARPM